MRQAIAAAIDWISHNVTAAPIDIVALSLACEFAAEAVLQQTPKSVRSLALISPSGMEGRRAGEKYEAGRTRQSKLALKMVRSTAFGRGLYRLLTTRASMQWFLSRTWGTKHFDRRLLEHSRECAALPGAEHLPLQFISGGLFTRGIIERYRALPGTGVGGARPSRLVHRFPRLPGAHRRGNDVGIASGGAHGVRCRGDASLPGARCF
jgi:hypothetical protein